MKIFNHYGTPQKINGVWKSFCDECGAEMHHHVQGLIDFGDSEHRKVCPSTYVESCPHCGRDIDD
jgi:hypothetical protein